MRDGTFVATVRLRPRQAICSGVLALCLSTGQAAVDVCRQPADYSYLSAGHYEYDESDTGGSNTVDLRSNSFDVMFVGSDAWRFGVGHRYDKFGFDPIELQTNGHLHSLFFPLHWQRKSSDKGFRVSLAPALTASSNIIDQPGEYSSDIFHLLAALTWSRQLSDQASFRYGLCGDTRFGEYAVYPTIGIAWQPHADWMVELGFPTAQVSYELSSSIDTSMRIAPDGNEWYVKDRDLQQDSQFVYEALLAEWAVNWKAHPKITITASIGRQFDIDYEVTLLDGSETKLSGDSTTRFGAALEWRF